MLALPPARARAPSLRSCAFAVDRRALLAGSALLPLLAAPPARASREVLEQRLVTELRAARAQLPAGPCLRLLFNDAAAGGRDGSVRFEADRPENAGLGATLLALGAVRDAVNASGAAGATPLSWTDALAWAARTAAKDDFDALLASRAAPGKGDALVRAYANPFEAALLGGVDAAAASPPGSSVAPPPGAGASAWLAAFAALGLRPAELVLLGPFVMGPDVEANVATLRSDAGLAARFDKLAPVMAQLGRTSFEVPFARAFDRLQRVGLRVDRAAYT